MENCDEEDCSEDEVDPRVKDELDALNAASVEINKLETEIDKARNKFRMLLGEATSRLNVLHKKLGKAVDKTRPYYEQLKQTKKIEVDLQKATVAFQRANSLYRAARETVELAEQRMAEKSSEDDRPEFNTAWQEMMNHATMKFMDAERERTQAEQNHQKCLAEFSQAQRKRLYLEKDIPRSINKSRPYFELKDHLETRLQQERQSVEDLQRALTSAKDIYRTALANLETISEEIHASRQLRKEPLPPRTPGVGAEAGPLLDRMDSNYSDSLSINLDAQSIRSEVMLDDADVTSLSSQDVNFVLDIKDKLSHPLASTGVEASVVNSGLTSNRKQASQQLATKQLNRPENCHTFQQIQGATKQAIAATSEIELNPEDFRAQGAIPKNYNKDFSSTNLESQGVSAGSGIDSTTLEVGGHVTDSESQNENNESTSFDSNSFKSSPNHLNSTLSDSTENSSHSLRSRPKDKRVQKLSPSQFPMLIGLMESNKKLSPKLPEGRPKGREIMSHHSPSPVRRNVDGYFEFPVRTDSAKVNGIAQEIQDAESLFSGSTGNAPNSPNQNNDGLKRDKDNSHQRLIGEVAQSFTKPTDNLTAGGMNESQAGQNPNTNNRPTNVQSEDPLVSNAKLPALPNSSNDSNIEAERYSKSEEMNVCDKSEVTRGEGEGQESEETVSCENTKSIPSHTESNIEHIGNQDLVKENLEHNNLQNLSGTSDNAHESQNNKNEEGNSTNNNNAAMGDDDNDFTVYHV